MPAPGPRVPIDADRLRAALKLSRSFANFRELADHVGVSHVTLSKIQCETTRTPGSSLVHKLADALDVPFDWLTGEQEHLRFARSVVEWEEEDGEYSRVEPNTADPTKLAGIHVAENRFLQLCYEALVRDLTPKYGSRKEAEEAYMEDDWWLVVESAMRNLIRPRAWRRKFFLGKTPPTKVRRVSRKRVRIDPTEEEAAEALATAFEFILKPWFDDPNQEMDIKAFTEVTAPKGKKRIKRKAKKPQKED